MSFWFVAACYRISPQPLAIALPTYAPGAKCQDVLAPCEGASGRVKNREGADASGRPCNKRFQCHAHVRSARDNWKHYTIFPPNPRASCDEISTLDFGTKPLQGGQFRLGVDRNFQHIFCVNAPAGVGFLRGEVVTTEHGQPPAAVLRNYHARGADGGFLFPPRVRETAPGRFSCASHRAPPFATRV